MFGKPIVQGLMAVFASLGLLLAAAATAARADTLFTYQGNNYTLLAGTYSTGGPYALSIQFVTTLSPTALANMSFTDITGTVISFQFTDGSGLNLNSRLTPSPNTEFQIATSPSGYPFEWLVSAGTTSTTMQTNWNSPSGFSPGFDFSETSLNFAGSYGQSVSARAGGWMFSGPGDANGDRKVDINDLTIVLTNFGQTGCAWTQGCMDGDPAGKVDVNDLTIVLANFRTTYGASSGIRAVPEPLCAALLGIGAACLLAFAWRKRRVA